MVNISRRSYSWFLFGEAYSMDEDYSTSAFVVGSGGNIDYEDKGGFLYEFVEDNDDQDMKPDWERTFQDRRSGLGPDLEVSFLAQQETDTASPLHHRPLRHAAVRLARSELGPRRERPHDAIRPPAEDELREAAHLAIAHERVRPRGARSGDSRFSSFFRVSRFWVQGSGFKVQGSRFWVRCSGSIIRQDLQDLLDFLYSLPMRLTNL